MPSNAQIDETLVYIGQHSPVNISQLSPDGQKLVSDSRDIIENFRRFYTNSLLGAYTLILLSYES